MRHFACNPPILNVTMEYLEGETEMATSSWILSNAPNVLSALCEANKRHSHFADSAKLVAPQVDAKGHLLTLGNDYPHEGEDQKPFEGRKCDFSPQR